MSDSIDLEAEAVIRWEVATEAATPLDQQMLMRLANLERDEARASIKASVAITTTQCDRCGSSLTLATAAEQDEDHGWSAWEDDEATCDDCGLVHYVQADGEHAWLDAGDEWEDLEPS